jgi:hypothetical protein
MSPRQWIGAAVIAMALPLVVSFASTVARPKADGPWLEPARAATSCMLPPDVMRQEHPRYLKDLRDEVVRDGRRQLLGGPSPRGIGSCSGCHQHKDRFCDRCHEQASVKPDCFECHDYD